MVMWTPSFASVKIAPFFFPPYSLHLFPAALTSGQCPHLPRYGQDPVKISEGGNKQISRDRKEMNKDYFGLDLSEARGGKKSSSLFSFINFFFLSFPFFLFFSRKDSLAVFPFGSNYRTTNALRLFFFFLTSALS